MANSKTTFGVIEETEIPLYVLENTNGMRVGITPYGATVTFITVPGEGGNPVHLAAGFDRLDGYFSPAYRTNAPYFGSTVGRYASRIKDGRFTLDGRDYTLDTNDGSNHLHGGVQGFDKRVWEVRDTRDDSITLSLISPDGDQGYPGRVDVSVTYRLSDQNELEVNYRGTTDAATPLSLTHHTYFNLSGFTDSIHDHSVRIQADEFLRPDATNVPVGERTSVNNDPADLRQPTELRAALAELPTGFEHYYAFPDGRTAEPRRVSTFSHAASGREMRVYTDEPGALFYTGYFTSDDLSRESGEAYGRYRAFCFEASRFPNGPNLDGAEAAITRAGEIYSSRTIYQFIF